jgi:fatty-acyl-CoA synthase
MVLASLVLAGSLLALVLALARAPRKRAVMLALGALLVSGLVLGRLSAFGAQAVRLPPLHDVQTDWSDPVMPSAVLLALRAGAENPLEANPLVDAAAEEAWPGLAGRPVAEVQEEAEFDPARQKSPRAAPYPKLAPLILPAEPGRAFTEVYETFATRGWEIVQADPGEGRLEATVRDFWFGLEDDILVRVRSAPEGVRIDIRAARRQGLTDLGENARRVRDLLDEIEIRLARPSPVRSEEAPAAGHNL